MTLKEVVARIEPADGEVAARARARHDQLTKPPGSLGRLEPLGVRLASVYGTPQPLVKGKGVAVFAADHGVTEAGVSAFPKEVTAQMVTNFLRGGAAVNALAEVANAFLWVVDVGVEAVLEPHPSLLSRNVAPGTKNMANEPAMTLREAESACEVGVEVADKLIREGATLLVGGEMGIGNTTAAAALTAVFTKRGVKEVTGRGTGVDDETLAHKVRVIGQALEKHQPDSARALDALAKVGGLEIAALTGFYLASAAQRVPVILDGFIATSAALVAAELSPDVKDYLFASHLSQEPGHKRQLEHLGLEPLFAFDMRLGEGSGAVLAFGILESAAAVLANMATFAEAGVAES